MGRYNPTERSGVHKVASIITDELNWVFREQAIVDVGIDAIIEQVINNNPTGKLIALQIKSGESYFKQQDDEYVYFRIDSVHYKYWLELCIPVLILLFDSNVQKTYWALFSEKEIKTTGNTYVLPVKKSNILGEFSRKEFSEIINYHLKSTLLDDLNNNEELDYKYLMEMCALYTDEATDIMNEINKYGYNLANKMLNLTNSIYQSLCLNQNISFIFNQIKANYNIYATKLKNNIPTFLKLRVNSLKYIELCIPHYDDPKFSALKPLIIDFFNETANSISIIDNMIGDIKAGLEVHKNDPNEYSPDVQISIKNKIQVEEEYIFTLENVNIFTCNVINSLPETIKKALSYSKMQYIKTKQL